MEGDLKRRPEDGLGTAVVDLAVAGLLEATNLFRYAIQRAQDLGHTVMAAVDSLPPIRPNGNHKPDGN